MALEQKIRERINESPDCTISFYEYMEIALYDHHEGYYSRKHQKIGKEGDYYTSVSVGGIFGEVLGGCLAEMIEEILRLSEDEPCYLIEFGGGTGDLAYEILKEWGRSHPYLLKKVELIMIEKSSYHTAVQQERLKGFPVSWFSDWNAVNDQFGKINGIVYSNELLDAFPVYVLEFTDNKWKEVRIGWNEHENKLYEVSMDVSSYELKQYIAREAEYIPKIEGYRIEANIDAEKWLQEIDAGLKNGYLLTIDYGFEREVLYLPQRAEGTMLCYQQHMISKDPLNQPGEKDITTHVHFSALMDIGTEFGFQNIGFFSQKDFLINAGIFQRMEDHRDVLDFKSDQAKRNRAIRQLIMPGGMGDTFRVLIQMKGTLSDNFACLESKGWT